MSKKSFEGNITREAKDGTIVIDQEEYSLSSNAAEFAGNYSKGQKVSGSLSGDMITFIKSADEGSVGSKKSSKGANWLDDYIDHETLLKKAHDEGLKRSNSELLTVDLERNIAIVKATIQTEKGTFSGLGDATPNNTQDSSTGQAIVRMAETRALNRAFRVATNTGKTTREELPESDLPENDGKVEVEEEDMT